MTNTYAVFHNGTEYTCSYFFDTNEGDGVDVKNAETQKHVGEMFGISIPDMDADEDETTRFELEIQAFIDENE